MSTLTMAPASNAATAKDAAMRDWLLDMLATSELAGAPSNDVLADTRRQAAQSLHNLALPQRKQEFWRYANIDKLFAQRFVPLTDTAHNDTSVTIDPHLLPGFDAHRLVLVNGRYSETLSHIQDLPDGVTLTGLRDALANDSAVLSAWFGHAANHHQHVFTALNTALINDGALLYVDCDVELDKPVEILHITTSSEHAALIQPRNLILLERGASAQVVERFVSSNDALYFNNHLGEIVLQQNAKLRHVRLQQESRQAYHLGSLFLSQQAHSEYSHTSIALGGAWARTDFNVDFEQENAACHLNGLYAVGDGQLQDMHLNVRHGVPNCSSTENFKGLLYGKGRAVFDGLVYVDKHAQGSDAQLSNTNLMLTRKAEVDTKPQLEIYADDVKCSHGTTVGQLDPQQLYYLRSRGIDEDSARSMLCLGFAGEIINGIDSEAVRQSVQQVVEALLMPKASTLTGDHDDD